MQGKFILGLAVAVLLGTTASSVQAQPDTLQVPDPFEGISVAMPEAESGDVILVSHKDPGNPSIAYGDAFTITSGVKVVAKAGQTPIIDGGTQSAYTVDFESGAVISTLFEGFTVRGGTSGAVRVRGGGTVRGCTVIQATAPLNYAGITSDGNTTVDGCSVTIGGTPAHRGISHTGGAPHITDCTVNIDHSIGIFVETSDPGSPGSVGRCSVTIDNGIGVKLSTGAYSVSDVSVMFEDSDRDNEGFSLGYTDDTYCTLENSFATVPEGIGVAIYSNNVMVSNVTVDYCGTGFWGHPSVDVSVHNCIATDYSFWNNEYGFQGVDAVYCIADNNRPYYSGSKGTGSVNEEPLYCDEANWDYTLRIDSYGNPGNNGSHQLIGAYPVACAYGTLTRKTELVENAEAVVWEDVIVPADSTLTLNRGSALRFDEYDESEEGEGYPPYNELTVAGKLIVHGTGAQPARFLSAEAPANAWQGLVFLEGSVDTIQYAEFQHAHKGVYVPEGCTFVIQNCEFDSLSDAITVRTADLVSGLVLNSKVPGFVEVNAPNLRILGNELDGKGVGPCLFLTENYADVEITGNTIVNCDLSAGVLVSDGRATLLQNTISDSKWGLHVEGDGIAVVGDSTDSDSDNTFSENTRGLSFVGVQGSSARALVRNNWFENNHIGAFVGSTGWGAYLDLGSTTQGKNSFVSNDSLCIWNRNWRNPSPIPAIGNWFGSYPFTPCWAGLVVADDPLQNPPAGALVNVRRVTPRLGIQGIWPNPAAGTATIELYLGADATAEIQVFDVAGRLVRTLDAAGSGEFRQVFWDARDRNGTAVGTGMYFVRVKANGRPVGTGRLLVTR